MKWLLPVFLIHSLTRLSAEENEADDGEAYPDYDEGDYDEGEYDEGDPGEYAEEGQGEYGEEEEPEDQPEEEPEDQPEEEPADQPEEEPADQPEEEPEDQPEEEPEDQPEEEPEYVPEEEPEYVPEEEPESQPEEEPEYQPEEEPEYQPEEEPEYVPEEEPEYQPEEEPEYQPEEEPEYVPEEEPEYQPEEEVQQDEPDYADDDLTELEESKPLVKLTPEEEEEDWREDLLQKKPDKKTLLKENVQDFISQRRVDPTGAPTETVNILGNQVPVDQVVSLLSDWFQKNEAEQKQKTEEASQKEVLLATKAKNSIFERGVKVLTKWTKADEQEMRDVYGNADGNMCNTLDKEDCTATKACHYNLSSRRCYAHCMLMDKSTCNKFDECFHDKHRGCIPDCHFAPSGIYSSWSLLKPVCGSCRTKKSCELMGTDILHSCLHLDSSRLDLNKISLGPLVSVEGLCIDTLSQSGYSRAQYITMQDFITKVRKKVDRIKGLNENKCFLPDWPLVKFSNSGQELFEKGQSVEFHCPSSFYIASRPHPMRYITCSDNNMWEPTVACIARSTLTKEFEKDLNTIRDNILHDIGEAGAAA